MSAVTTTNPGVLSVNIFGSSRRVTVRRNPRNWGVEWEGMSLVTSVPRSMAICAQEAAHKAAAAIEAKPWGAFLAARIREIREHDGALSTETSMWVVAKSEGRPFERHASVRAGETMEKALARLEAQA